jgi:uncharacterized repeat protein (TIGR02543 family)
LSNAKAGDTVALATSGVEGTTSTYYVGNFTLSSGTASLPVTIAPASGVTDPILDGNGGSVTGCPTTICNGPVLSIGSGVYTTIEGITVQDAANHATKSGGGMFLGNNADVTVTGSTFSNDLAEYYGGGIVSGLDGATGTLTITNSAFSDDTAGYGGAIDSGDNGTGTLTVTNSTFSGDSAPYGGGIDSGLEGNGTLTVTNSTFSGDSASDDFGGGIDSGQYGTGTLTVTNSTFSDDIADDGGAIDSGQDGGTGILTVTGSTFSDDTGDTDGGGIDSGDIGTGTLTVKNSTFSGDGAAYGGGAYNQGTGTLTDDTFSGDSGGGVNNYSTGSTATISNSILDVAPCEGTISDGGYNVEDDNSCGFGSTDVVSNSTIHLASSLAANGSSGPETLAIGTNSSAYEEVPSASCTLTTDERGDPRPGVTGAKCDAGAFEYQLPAGSYTVTFDANGGSGTMANETENSTTALTTNTFTRTGYTFSGWNTAANGTGTSYSDGASYAFNASVTLYAQWTANSYTVTFDANGGSGTMASETENTPTALTTNTFTRTGYTFSGWNTAADGTGTSYSDGASYAFNASVTLYAQWTANSGGSGGSSGSGPTAPGTPTDLTVTAGNGQASFTWSAPSSNGGAAITAYTVTCSPSGSVTVSGTSATITGLTNGTAYTCSVVATNSAGTGSSSSSVTVTPKAPAPSNLCSTYTKNDAFLCAVYEDLLGRAPDAGDLAFWDVQLAGGVSRSAVAYDIVTSVEYRNHLVTSCYETFLGRAAESGGLSYWVAQLNGEASDQWVVAGFLGSSEFYTDSGSTPAGFVTALYEKLLGRAAEPEGLAFWENLLSSGVSRNAVAAAILSSTEYLSDFVESQYHHLLGRAADQGGLSFWVTQLAGGASNESVIAGFVGSAEYYSETTST